MQHNESEEHLLGCEDCQKRVPFEMPAALFEDCKYGRVVVFAGAGISTEGRGVFPSSFYEEIKEELDISEEIDFDNLMSKFVLRTKDKRALLNKIKNRIDYAKSFPELEHHATTFHKELSSIHQIQEIITTNWDDFFERECGATPIVTDKDFAYWDQPFRKVFKIHGSINNPGSIIATKEDYSTCYKELSKNVIGATLKQLLATKTIIFVGYSFRDTDFVKIYSYLQKNMGSVLPHAYFVSLNEPTNEDLKKFTPTIIKTDATHFLAVLKQKLIEEKQLVPDLIYELTYYNLLSLKDVHLKISEKDIKKDPALIYCLSYQDGLIHALERALQNKNTGEYSHLCKTGEKLKHYVKLRKAFLKRKRYLDVAYIDGYIVGLAQLIPESIEKQDKMPIYYVFGAGPIDSNAQFLKTRKLASKLHKAAFDVAKKMTEKYKRGIVLHHNTFLMDISETD